MNTLMAQIDVNFTQKTPDIEIYNLIVGVVCYAV